MFLIEHEDDDKDKGFVDFFQSGVLKSSDAFQREGNVFDDVAHGIDDHTDKEELHNHFETELSDDVEIGSFIRFNRRFLEGAEG